MLCECCAELFDGTAPGIDEDFFSLGVDSIVAISLVNKARKRDLVITPRMVLAAPTIRQLAALVDTRGHATAPEWSPANREWCAAKVCSAESSCPRANPLMPPSPMPRGKPLIPWTRARAR
ncbi:non-ribosomal peptide synthetase MbtF [Mycobacteroides abscessus subsp. abscessus]|nr:non-ribosomal peptide synthetase MbtF [Mycobacteroides abscessus subsp. abscessus]